MHLTWKKTMDTSSNSKSITSPTLTFISMRELIILMPLETTIIRPLVPKFITLLLIALIKYI